MAITTGLYPPIVADTIPAFIRTKICKIYFSLSIYNSEANIKNVQVSLINQRTNASAFKNDLYPSGIKITDMIYDPNSKGDYNYYIQINPSDLTEQAFGLNQFYKVQLRFTSNAASEPPSNGPQLATWLYDNMQYFSEWSKVCLIKGIEQPHISIRGFSDSEGYNEETVFTNSMIEIIGKLTYIQNQLEEKEHLKSYNIKLYQADDMDTILMQSQEIYTNPHNPNEFNYQLSYDLLDGINYVMTLTYTTNNLYTETINYKFTIIQYGVDKLNADITATVDEENGRIKIDIISKDPTQKFIGNLTIRRTSSESNFHKWEDVKTITYATGSQLNYTWYDNTVQSGVWYKYCAQRRNVSGDRGVIIQIDNPVMCLFEDIFLTREECQLKIKFNPSLNEFKYNVMESQQTTIGAKYPYVKRNGNNYFRTFPIGGLISALVDQTDWYDPHFYNGEFHNDENEIKAFTSKAEIYGDSEQLYNNYNDQNRINEYNDYVYEREFRKKVYDFLYKHNVKLFRSTTEGNILIKLMNIDFQPVESLGRRLYSFTATAVEIDDATILNYDKYGIQSTDTYEKYVVYKHDVFGQISGTYTAADGNILHSKINAKYEQTSNDGFINKVSSLKWLKLEIESDPYVIIEENGQLIKADTSSNINAADATIGYIVIINDTEMIVYPRMERYPSGNPGDGSTDAEIVHLGIFELKQSNTLITNLKFKYPTTVTIDYTATLEEIEDSTHLITQVYYYHKPGQLYGTFNTYDSLVQKIYNKYLFNYTKYYQRLLDITNIQIEGPPGAVIYMKDSNSSELKRFVLENGYLQFKQDDINIEGLYFCGVHLNECTSGQPKDNEYILINEPYDSILDIENPVPNGVYNIALFAVVDKDAVYDKINDLLIASEESIISSTNQNYALIIRRFYEESNRYIYYHNNWYLFSSDHTVLCPVDGIVNYYCEILKGVY